MKGKYGILSLLPYPNIPPPLSLEKSPYPFPILYKSFNSVPRIITHSGRALLFNFYFYRKNILLLL